MWSLRPYLCLFGEQENKPTHTPYHPLSGEEEEEEEREEETKTRDELIEFIHDTHLPPSQKHWLMEGD